MIPEISDPVWTDIVNNPDAYKTKVSSMATKMMLATIKIRAGSESVGNRIKYAYDYFNKNESALAEDIAALFE